MKLFSTSKKKRRKNKTDFRVPKENILKLTNLRK
jgi:hypothetical protein